MTLNSWTESYGDRYFYNGQQYDMSSLKIDDCFFTINNTEHDKIYLYSKYEECIGCPFLLERDNPFPKNDITTFIVDTKYPKLYRFLTDKVNISLENDTNVIGSNYFSTFNEFGVYKFDIDRNGIEKEILKQPVNIYFPILTVFIIYLAIFIGIYLLQYYWKKFSKRNADENVKEENNNSRIQSLDTFRGISVVVMIFANYGHGGYPFLEHAIWNGLYVGDLAFPWFLWIMGVCIPLSASKRETSKSNLFKKILRRSCILFALGIFLGSGTNIEKFRISGVQQRFAISYFVSATLHLFTLIDIPKYQENRIYNLLKDVISLAYQWIVIILIMILYSCLIFSYEVPNCGSGYLGPGGYHDNGKYKGCTGGFTGYLDRLILGERDYEHSILTDVYKSQFYEGILGYLPIIFQVFLGVQAGMTLVTYKSHKSRLQRWLLWCIITGLIGGLLCGFSKEDGVIPLNKKLWSLSFTFVTASFAFGLLLLCYIVIDVKHLWNGKPFLFAGMNAIIMYVGHNMTYSNFPIRWRLSDGKPKTHFIALIENIWATTFWVLVSYVLYRKKRFISI